MKKLLLIAFILTFFIFIRNVNAFCCKDPATNQWKCYGTGYCCNDFWSSTPCQVTTSTTVPITSTIPAVIPEFNMSFWAVNFAVDVKNVVAGSVGETINIPVHVQNLGVLIDNYTVNATPISFPEYIVLENNLLTTDILKANEFGSVYFRVTPLSKPSTNPQIGLWIYSNADKYSCSSAADCNVIQNFERNTTCEVVSRKCAIYRIVELSSGLKSMPEIGFFGLLQIFVFASLIALVTFK